MVKETFVLLSVLKMLNPFAPAYLSIQFTELPTRLRFSDFFSNLYRRLLADLSPEFTQNVVSFFSYEGFCQNF